MTYNGKNGIVRVTDRPNQGGTAGCEQHITITYKNSCGDGFHEDIVLGFIDATDDGVLSFFSIWCNFEYFFEEDIVAFREFIKEMSSQCNDNEMHLCYEWWKKRIDEIYE